VTRLAGEDLLIDWLRRQAGAGLIGDDAALLPAGGPFAVTVDHQIAGVHFPAHLEPSALARRLLAVNLSDLAAAGASPAWAFLALAAPRGFDHRRFFRALLAACRAHGLQLAGGDLARHPHELTAAMTLIGTKGKGARWLRRDGAATGQHVWVGGTVGESAAGRLLIAGGARPAGPRIDLPRVFEGFLSLRPAARRAVRRHLEPRPQLALGRWLGSLSEGAAIDVSDGLARDLHRLCRASGVGAEIDERALPLAGRFGELCQSIAADPLALALGGGEDYVLLFTLAAGIAPPDGFKCRRIGTITQGGAVTLVRDGVRRELPDLGWDHLATAPPPLS
jgi:thiamine-monophosphate kinase